MANSACTRWLSFIIAIILFGCAGVLSWWINDYKGYEPSEEICGYSNCTSFKTYITITYSFYIAALIIFGIFALVVWSGNSLEQTMWQIIAGVFAFVVLFSWIVIWVYYSKGWRYPITSLEYIPFILWIFLDLIIAVLFIGLIIYFAWCFCKSFNTEGLCCCSREQVV